MIVMLADKDVGNEANYKTAKEWWCKYCNVKTPGYEYFGRDGVRYKRIHTLLKKLGNLEGTGGYVIFD